MTERFPVMQSVVVDTTDARRSAELYRQLLGYTYRPGDEPPPEGEPDPKGRDWLVLRAPSGEFGMGFQQVDSLSHTTWPSDDVPMQLHLDFVVADDEDLAHQYERALELGATLRLDRTDDPDEPLYVLADPDGHPFCMFVG